MPFGQVSARLTGGGQKAIMTAQNYVPAGAKNVAPPGKPGPTRSGSFVERQIENPACNGHLRWPFVFLRTYPRILLPRYVARSSVAKPTLPAFFLAPRQPVVQHVGRLDAQHDASLAAPVSLCFEENGIERGRAVFVQLFERNEVRLFLVGNRNAPGRQLNDDFS